MRDLLGNKISETSLLWWISKALPLRVARIEAGGIIVGGEETPEKLILELTIPIARMKDGAEAQLSDFLCTLNPDAERILEGMLEKQRRQ